MRALPTARRGNLLTMENGIAKMISGCLKLFCSLRWAGMPNLSAFLYSFRLP
ncbi:MAG: hypothetical protein IKZ88_05605 [Neisseriaceae bacterium]|nr:hypothetical protein [Neisseriaceae bacterium]